MFAVHVLVNGREIGGSPYLLEVTPGNASNKHSYVTYLAFSPIESNNLSLESGEVLFFTLNLKDQYGATTSEEI